MDENSTNTIQKAAKFFNVNDRICHIQLLLIFFSFFGCMQSSFAQSSNSDFERLKIGNQESNLSSVDISPDGKTIAISSKKSSPVQIMDWKSRKVIHEFDAGNWYSGSKIRYSATGKYLLLQELEYKDFSLNKPRNIAFELIDAETGGLVRKFENVQDVLVSDDEKYALSFDEEEIHFWNLTNGSEEKKIHASGAANAIGLSSDGKILAVSEIISPQILKNSFGKDKKGAKAAAKYKQMISLYDVETGSKLKTVAEFYDIIYKLKFSPGGEFIIVSQTPEVSTQISTNKISFISLIDAASYEPLRKGFTSMSIDQPALHFSSDQKFFAINSKGNKFQEIHLYDSETGTLQKRFELGKRIFEKVDGEKLFSDSRPSFAFLPGNQSILIAMGNQLVVWNYEFNE
jgi:WD40 repeat protein